MNLRIKEILKEKGLTIVSLSEKMGMHRVQLSGIIKGNPTIDTIEKIAQALDVPVTSLFENESEIYGVVIFRGRTYKIDSDQELKTFLNDYKALPLP